MSCREDLFEVPALDVLHGDIHETGLRILTNVMDGDDPRMVEPARSPRFANEAFTKLFGVVGVEVDAQGLERNQTVDDRIAGEVNHSHRPASERLFELIASDSLLRHHVSIVSASVRQSASNWRRGG